MSKSLMSGLRQPEYTGENRCLPCTAANVVIAVALSLAIVYLLGQTVSQFAWIAGTVVFVTGLGAIWVRGYIVPGTPELTKRYFPDRVLQLFDKGPDVGTTPGGLTITGEGEGASSDGHGEDEPPSLEEINVHEILLSTGVVAPCDDRDDLCLTDDFRTGWYDRMQSIDEVATERDDLARELDVDPTEIEFEEHGDAFVAETKNRRVGQWESHAALVADLAAARELPEWIDDWPNMHLVVRSQLLGGLRVFLDSCPDCEGPVDLGTETVGSCCNTYDILAANCEACDARLLEIRHPEPA